MVGEREIAIIGVSGHLSTQSAGALDQAIKSLLQSNCHNIILDLVGTEYIDHSGWSTLFSHIKEIFGDLKLAGMKSELYELYEALGFSSLFSAYATLEDAISAFDIPTTE